MQTTKPMKGNFYLSSRAYKQAQRQELIKETLTTVITTLYFIFTMYILALLTIN